MSVSFAATASATAELVGGFVVKLDIVDSGSGYLQAPGVTISGGGGSGARAIAEISGGKVVNLIVTSAGVGYTNTPQVNINPPPGGFRVALKLKPKQIMLSVHAVLGHQYQIETSNDRSMWTPVGSPFVPKNEYWQVAAPVDQVGSYLRVTRLD
jgi:hypothetical protein